MRHFYALCLLLVSAVPAFAQIDTAPMGSAPPPNTVAPAYGQGQGEPPPVLPQNPARRAIEAAANGGSGGMSYAGPSGAMNTSPNGSSCAVTCNVQPLEQYQVKCNAGFTAMCQCDVAPLAGCRKQ